MLDSFSMATDHVNVNKPRDPPMRQICSFSTFVVDRGKGGRLRNRKRHKRGIKEVTSCDASVAQVVASTETKIYHDQSSKQLDKFDSSKSSRFSDDHYFFNTENKLVKPLRTLEAGGDGDGEDDTQDDTLTCLSHGWVSLIGRRRLMEDAVTVAPRVAVADFNKSYDLFAVYDGHGGARVANACKNRMHQMVAEEVMMMTGGEEENKGLDYWEKVMAVSFEKMDKEVMMSGGDEMGVGEESDNLSVKKVGSTAVVVMVGKEEVVVANCGDSRAVLCCGGVAVPLSCDHKPDRPDERERVEAAGGRVINWDGSRILGVLATSRSIGDQYLKPFVISEPEVTLTERTELDDFIVIASDGLWDVVSNEAACEVVRKCFASLMRRRFNCAADAAAMLAELAIARGSEDNISVIVVELNRSSSRTL